ncbi:MAG: DUF4250 domain-containing protein [Epulopiscium sp.]|nr:DUF4250 domain-containing protein [Candidatus Epulonipiscium sp.]
MNSRYIPLGDPFILLSWVNMKLRDECKDLEQLCDRYEVSEEIIRDTLGAVGYVYVKKTNQFIYKDAATE